jgi:hypothetical protein
MSIKFTFPFTVRAGFEELLLIISCPFMVTIPLTSDDNPYDTIEESELTPGFTAPPAILDNPYETIDDNELIPGFIALPTTVLTFPPRIVLF